MGKERIKRLLILMVAGILMIGSIDALVKWKREKENKEKTIKLPLEGMEKKIEEFGERVLGKAIEILPGSEEIKRKIEEEVHFLDNVRVPIPEGEHKKEKKEEAGDLENQVREIVEIIKQLPQEQFKQIKKQFLKDFCEEIIKE